MIHQECSLSLGWHVFARYNLGQIQTKGQGFSGYFLTINLGWCEETISPPFMSYLNCTVEVGRFSNKKLDFL